MNTIVHYDVNSSKASLAFLKQLFVLKNVPQEAYELQNQSPEEVGRVQFNLATPTVTRPLHIALILGKKITKRESQQLTETYTK